VNGFVHQCKVEKLSGGIELIVTTTLSTLLSLVEQGIGSSILPRLLDYMNRDNISAVTLLNPTPSQDICILYRTDRFMG
jgi:DNA-binding transcriptional LysR family regulator